MRDGIVAVSLILPWRRVVAGYTEHCSLELSGHSEVGEESPVDLFDPLLLQVIQPIMARLVGTLQMDVYEIVFSSQSQNKFRSPPLILHGCARQNLSHLHS